MADLPSGTVTFLFTDIEGSTRLLQCLGDRYAEVLVEHHKLLRAAFQQTGGQEIDTQGDAFFVVFRRASDAVAATVAAQRAIAAHPWPEGAPVRVRMGLHTGEPILTTAGYIGLDVHRAARICSAGHGGQVLISQTTRALLCHDLPSGVGLRDLGQHRLKDLTGSEQIFQLVIPELSADFPPLKSLDALPNNLPVQLTSFIGREKEMDEVKSVLKNTRLLTLTGMGGCGKTRLAIQVAADLLEEYPDGVWLVELATLVDSALVPQAVASALSVREAPGRALLTTLCDALQSRQLLLVLDNCEHVIEACAQLVETLLRRCAKLRILATSRELLGAAGEVAWRVPPLSLPDPQGLPTAESLAHYEAVRLFTERARAASSTFTVTDQNAPALVQICQRLDGIPLAIELAAARVKVLSPEQIAARLDDRFKLLTGGSRTAVRRQQTLQAAIDWSYSLLTERERVLLRRLSVFADGCTIEAAEAVCAEDLTLDPSSSQRGVAIGWGEVLDLLTQLVDKSLVLKDEVGGAARYQLLETIRQYGQDKLMEANEATILRERHLDFFVRYAEQAQPELEGTKRGPWLMRLEAEKSNLRAALEWSKADVEKANVRLRLARALWRFWEMHGYFSEGRQWLEGALADSGSASAVLRVPVLFGAGVLALHQGDFGRSAALLEESLALYRELGDKSGIARALNGLGSLTWHQGNYRAARSLYEESLAIRRELGDRLALGTTLSNLGAVANSQGDHGTARALFAESLEIQRQLGDQRGIATTLNNLASTASYQGDFASARPLFEESLAINRELGDKRGIALALSNLGDVANAQGDFPAARALLEEGLVLARDLGDKRQIALILNNLGSVAANQGDYRSARALFEESLAIRREMGNRQSIALVLTNLAGAMANQGDPRAARALLEEGLAIQRELDDKRGMVESLDCFARVAVLQGEFGRAARLFGSAKALRDAVRAPLSPVTRADYERTVAAARSLLGDAAFTAAWDEGQTMALEQTIDYALEKDGS